MLFIHSLFKPKHTIVELLIKVFRHIGVVRVEVMAVIELNYMKSAAVHIKVYIPLFKIRSDGLPDLHLRVELFHFSPLGISDTFAVDFR